MKANFSLTTALIFIVSNAVDSSPKRQAVLVKRRQKSSNLTRTRMHIICINYAHDGHCHEDPLTDAGSR